MSKGSWIDRVEEWAAKAEEWGNKMEAWAEEVNAGGAGLAGGFGSSGAKSSGASFSAILEKLANQGVIFGDKSRVTDVTTTGDDDSTNLEDPLAEARYGRREPYNAEKSGRKGTTGSVAGSGSGVGSSTTAKTAATAHAGVVVTEGNPATASETAPEIDNYALGSIENIGSNTAASAEIGSKTHLQELLGGDFDIRRAVIESEILNRKYF